MLNSRHFGWIRFTNPKCDVITRQMCKYDNIHTLMTFFYAEEKIILINTHSPPIFLLDL